jgi:hypothetical protein
MAAPNSARLPLPKHPGHSNMPARCARVQPASIKHSVVGAIAHVSVSIGFLFCGFNVGFHCFD